MAALAGRFSFKKYPLPEAPNAPPHKLVRKVLDKPEAWLEAVPVNGRDGIALRSALFDGEAVRR